MASSDPGVQASGWKDWALADADVPRSANSAMTDDWFTRWYDRDRHGRGRSSIAPSFYFLNTNPSLAINVWQSEAALATRFYFPPWAGVLVAVMTAKIDVPAADVNDATISGRMEFRVKVGASDYSGTSSVWLQCNPGPLVPPGPPACTGVGLDADDMPHVGSGTYYRKRCLFTVPAAMLDTEQTIQIQYRRGTMYTRNEVIANDGQGRNAASWYFVPVDAT